LWSLAVAVVLVGCRSRASGVFRVVVAVRWVTVTAREVLIYKAGAVTVMVVVVVGLRWLVERRGLIIIQTQIPAVVGVMPVRLVRALTVVADRIVRVLVAVVVTVGMAVVAVVVRRMAALVVVAGLVT
jgi:hypothetical protein